MDLQNFKRSLIAAFRQRFNISNTELPNGFNVATITDTVFLMIQNDRNLSLIICIQLPIKGI
jgi:hypothetical protein